MHNVTKIIVKVKDTEALSDLCSDLGYDVNKSYELFERGEVAEFELIIDREFNVIGGKLIPHKKS